MPKEGTMPSLPKPASPLWGDWTDIEVKAATVIWVNRMVIGLDLCCDCTREEVPGERPRGDA